MRNQEYSVSFRYLKPATSVHPIRTFYFSVTTASAHDGDNNLLEAGDVIYYTLEVSNTGNACLRHVVLSDLLGVVNCGDSDTGAPSLRDTRCCEMRLGM